MKGMGKLSAVAIVAALLVAGCGGGGGSSGDSPFGEGGSSSGGSGSSSDADSPISVSVGASDQIVDGDTSETYVQEFTVQVVDSHGYPVKGASITPTVSLPYFSKGYWGVGTDNKWGQYLTDSDCANEDVNGNGTLDAGEDLDKDGQLAPRAADVTVSFIDSKETDANGQMKVRIQYLQSSASWVAYKLIVSARVSTTEGTGTYSSWLGWPADQTADTTTALPFGISPYGTGTCVATSS